MEILKDYQEKGAVFPIDVLSQEELQNAKNEIENFLKKNDYKLDSLNRHKPHIYLKWVRDLAKHPKIIEPLKRILGEDILLWYSVVFVKMPGTGEKIPWHQDSTYWAMNEEKGLTVWLALSDVNPENGCMYYIPGSHTLPDLPHVISRDQSNMLHRGQKLKGVDEAGMRPIEINAGQASIHELRTLHKSEPNTSPAPRLGIAFRFIPASNYPKTLKWMKRSATLVSGKCDFKHFRKDPDINSDYEPHAMKFLNKSLRIAAIHTLFGDTSRSGVRKFLDAFPTLTSRKLGMLTKNWKKLLG